jgi:DNA polymerase-3 subunit delta
VDSELEKLALYVGDRASIELADVELLVERSREEEYLELSNALQARKFNEVLDYGLQAMGQGQHPLQILGAVASVLRRMVADKERYARMKLSSRMSYRDFQEDVYPVLQEEAKKDGKKLGHAYVCYLGWQAQSRYERAELLKGLLAAGDCDLAIKSSADPRAALERLLIQICAKPA